MCLRRAGHAQKTIAAMAQQHNGILANTDAHHNAALQSQHQHLTQELHHSIRTDAMIHPLGTCQAALAP